MLAPRHVAPVLYVPHDVANILEAARRMAIAAAKARRSVAAR